MYVHKISLRSFNNMLSVFVALLALYIVAVPYLPQASWWLRHDSPVRKLIPEKRGVAAAPATAPITDGDKLFIPRMELEERIYGGGEENLDKGVWHVDGTSTPDGGGNTVLVGHRFTYRDPTGGVFYHLDKVAVGDAVVVHWQGKAYEYKVAEVKVVPADEVSVEADTARPRLTIYTCTPLWSVANRLVVIANPLEGAARAH